MQQKICITRLVFISFCFFTSLFISCYAVAIEIDGALTEAEWGDANVISSFTTIEPYSLNEPKHKTEAKVYVDKTGIFIGIINYQPIETQQIERLQRDASIRGDDNRVIIDFDDNNTSAYGFDVGNGGTIVDGIWSDETHYSNDWDGNWKAKTISSEDRWVSEIFIPWSVAPMASAEGDFRSVGLYIGRKVAYLGEQYANSPISGNRSRFLSDIESIEIENHSSASFEVFISGTVRKDLLGDDDDKNASLDLFWQPNASKQLSLALNPDFGQVESDSLVVNFSPNETFFDEKRPFFTENQSLFDIRGGHSLRVVHTRRIGGESDIDAAVKFTANGSKVNYGVFAVSEHDSSEENGRNYFVARVSHKSNNARFGYMGSYVDRPELNRIAKVHVLDYDVSLNKKVAISGSVIHSDVSGLDALGGDYVDYQDFAGTGKVKVQSSKNWRNLFEVTSYGDEFEINDLGFLPRNDLLGFHYNSDWQKPAPENDKYLKKYGHEFSLDYSENQSGDRLYSGVSLKNHWQFKNTATIYLETSYEAVAYDDRITRGNRMVEKPSGYSVGYHYVGKQRKKIRYHHMFYMLNDPIAGKGFYAHLHPTFVFTENLSLVWSLEYSHLKNWWIWQDNNYINTYERDKFVTSVDINAQFNDKHELRIKFQWLSLAAEGEKPFIVSENGNLEEQLGDVEDFSLSDTALQIRYRYELGPLSNIYLVYSRGALYQGNKKQNVFGAFSEGWDERQGDNFLIKVRVLL